MLYPHHVQDLGHLGRIVHVKHVLYGQMHVCLLKAQAQASNLSCVDAGTYAMQEGPGDAAREPSHSCPHLGSDDEGHIVPRAQITNDHACCFHLLPSCVPRLHRTPSKCGSAQATQRTLSVTMKARLLSRMSPSATSSAPPLKYTCTCQQKCGVTGGGKVCEAGPSPDPLGLQEDPQPGPTTRSAPHAAFHHHACWQLTYIV